MEGRLIKPKSNFIDRTIFFENFSIYNNHTHKPIDALFTPTLRPVPIDLTTTEQTLPFKVIATPKPPDPIYTKKYPSRQTTTRKPPPIRITTRKPIVKEDNTTELITIYQIDENATSLVDSNASDSTEITKRRRPTLITTTEAPNCTKDEEVTIDPFKLFEFAQKLEREGFQNYTTTLKGLCWETSFGQELVKLTLTDLYMTIVTTIFADYLRAVVIRYCNGWPCCSFIDLEITFPGMWIRSVCVCTRYTVPNDRRLIILLSFIYRLC